VIAQRVPVSGNPSHHVGFGGHSLTDYEERRVHAIPVQYVEHRWCCRPWAIVEGQRHGPDCGVGYGWCSVDDRGRRRRALMVCLRSLLGDSDGCLGRWLWFSRHCSQAVLDRGDDGVDGNGRQDGQQCHQHTYSIPAHAQPDRSSCRRAHGLRLTLCLPRRGHALSSIVAASAAA
jgi:hypothetical protein